MTVLLDKEAFRFYTPKELHSHLRQFDDYLVRKAREVPAISKLLEHPLALFPTDVAFPIVHVTALYRDGQWRYFSTSLDRYKRREGHRQVKDGKAGDGIRGMQPWLRLEVVTDPNLTAAATPAFAREVLAAEAEGRSPWGMTEAYTELAKGAAQPAVLFTAPLAMMKRGLAAKYLRQRFTLYQHIFGAGHEYPDDGLFYIGITARDWKKRWSEHRAAIHRGSPLKFHRAYRERVAARQLTYVHHKVMGVAPTLDEVQQLEEIFVAGHWDDARLLNMIPGGKAGIAYLHQHGIMGKKVIPTPDHVERVLEDWLREHPRKGLPAPWVAEKWKDDSYALKIICGPEGRLSVEQVMAIRAMASGGVDLDRIVEQTGAKSRLQVQRVLDGKTYTRVPDIPPE